MTPRHRRPTALKEFLFGAPYYPEHWSEKDREDDAERMAAAGMNVVRMAEFAWDLMEPSPGRFDFSLFDETIEKLASRGIRTILCTPTAAPPRWLSLQHPDWMRVNRDGQPMIHGSRQHFCTNQPGFVKESARITRAMAAHFRGNPHVIGWQTDNEFHCHINECYCPACLTAFQSWLNAKYGKVDALNPAWGTAFWAQTYRNFSEVPFPYPDRPTHANPGHQLDFNRFLSDSLTAFQAAQIKVLRKANPSWWISHNGIFDHIDHWKFAEGLDFYGVDVYPGFSFRPGHPEPDPVWSALKHQECRAASGNFVVFEQQGGAGGQRPYLLPTPRPGQMRLWAWQAVAHGADGVLHFRWRTCRFGAEIYWNGILDHDNIPRRRYREFATEGEEFRRMGPKLLGTSARIDVGVLVEQDQDEAHGTMPLGQSGPWDQRKHVYRELQKRHLACGLINAADSFEGLHVIFLPGFVLMDDGLARKLHAFVEAGGILVASARTATRNRHNGVFSITAPALLDTCFGITVEEFGAHDALSFQLGDTSVASDSYFEILQPLKKGGAHVLARWEALADSAPHAAPGQPAFTVRKTGKGKAYYLGTHFGAENTPRVLEAVLRQESITPLAAAPEVVEITGREGQERRLLFLLNHSGREQKVSKLPAGKNLLTSKATGASVSLPAYGVAVIEVQNR
jgi:beta-galactosidase